MSNTIFVTGASGQLGRLVIDHLLARGVPAARIVAGSRSPDKLGELAAKGIATRRADFDDPASLRAAFDGAHTVLIVSTDALDDAGTRQKQHRNAVEAAAAAGAARIAYTSLPNPACSLLSFAPDHRETERAIVATGLPYLFFRNGWYHENLLRSLPHALQAGQWYSAAKGAKTSYVSRSEIAEAIAAALILPEAGSRIYTLTGAEALSNEAIAALASRATGKPLAVVHVSDEQLLAGLTGAGIPPAFLPVLMSIEKELRAGNLSIVTDHVETLIGREPKSLAAYFEEAKAGYAG